MGTQRVNGFGLVYAAVRRFIVPICGLALLFLVGLAAQHFAPRSPQKPLASLAERCRWRGDRSCMDGEAYVTMKLLKKLNASIVTAESLTGGLIAAALVDQPGFGPFVYGGFATYDVDAKRRILNVTIDDIYTHQCASQMALGALRLSTARVAVSVTGHAGPVSCKALDYLGVVHIGVAIRDMQCGGQMAQQILEGHTILTRQFQLCSHGAGADSATKTLCDDYKTSAAQSKIIKGKCRVPENLLRDVRDALRRQTTVEALRMVREALGECCGAQYVNCAKWGGSLSTAESAARAERVYGADGWWLGS